MLAARAASSSSACDGVGPAEADVLLDRAVEQEGVLVHHRDQRADLRERQSVRRSWPPSVMRPRSGS